MIIRNSLSTLKTPLVLNIRLFEIKLIVLKKQKNINREKSLVLKIIAHMVQQEKMDG